MALDGIFSAILANFTGVLTRSVGAVDEDKGAFGVNRITTFYHLARLSEELQHNRWSLFADPEGSNKPVKPIGVETYKWSSNQQFIEYKKIRDQALDLFVRVTAQANLTPQFWLLFNFDQRINDALETIQQSIYETANLETFEDGLSSIAKGLKTATSIFGEILANIP